MHPPSLEEAIFSARFIRWTAVITSILLVVIVAGHITFVIVFPRSPLFFRFQLDVDQEGNWTTWYNSTIDMAAGVAAITLAWLAHRSPIQLARAFSRRWLVIGATLIYLGVDDAAQIHEHSYGLITSAINLLGQWIPGILQYRWFIWIPILGIPAIIFLVWIAKLIYQDIRSNHLARLLFITGIVLLLTNPITEYMQAKLTQPASQTSAPQFSEQLFQTDNSAWLQLEIIDLTQEASEIAAVSCLLLAFLLIGEDIVMVQSEQIQRATPV